MTAENKYSKIKRIEELIEILKVGPGSDKEDFIVGALRIQEVEKSLGLELPEEYKEFLQKIGWIFGIEYGGLNSAIKMTLQLRENYADKFSKNLIPLHGDGYGNYHCLVCGGKDNGRVIFWQHDVYDGQEYPNIPPGKPEDFWIEAPDFWTWLLERLEEKYKEKEEEKK